MYGSWLWFHQHYTVSRYDLLNFSRRLPKLCCWSDLNVSSFDFKNIIFVYFVCIWCLFTTQFSLIILGQISAACSESWYRKLEFCVTSFWFYCHRLWWNSWHATLVLFLLFVYFVWIFSWRDLFQLTGTDATCVPYIICSALSKSRSILPIAIHALFVSVWAPRSKQRFCLRHFIQLNFYIVIYIHIS